MKEGWEYKKLGETCNIDFGTRVVRSRDAGSIYPVYGGGGATFKMDMYNRENCMVISRFGMSEQCTRFVKGKFFLNDSGLTLSMKENCMIQEFMDWQILYLNNTIYSLGRGAAQKNLDTKALAEVRITYPNNLSEQQSIVDYLDSAFAKIDAMKANAEKALNEAKALFQASLKEMLEPKEGVKWSTIGDLFETYSGGTPTKSNNEYYEGGSIPWLRSGEVCQKDITRTEMFITEKGLKDSSAKYYPENTVVVAMYGATAAQVGILRIKSTSNQAVCGILPHKDFLPEYVYYWFRSIEDKLAAQAQGGAQPNISQLKIKKVKLPIYSMSIQQSIVATLDSLKSKVDRIHANYDKISQECDALKQAILKQVFE